MYEYIIETETLLSELKIFFNCKERAFSKANIWVLLGPKKLAQNIRNSVWRETLLSWAFLLDADIYHEEHRKLCSCSCEYTRKLWEDLAKMIRPTQIRKYTF